MNLPAAMEVINSAIAMNNISCVSNFLFIYVKMPPEDRALLRNAFADSSSKYMGIKSMQ
jgi:hypothetical protein